MQNAIAMTSTTPPSNNGSSRLDRIELLVEANAKAIEAMRIELRDGISDAVAIITQISEEAAAERAAIKQRQTEADERFQVLLEEARADRLENQRQHEEFRQAIQALLERQ